MQRRTSDFVPQWHNPCLACVICIVTEVQETLLILPTNSVTTSAVEQVSGHQCHQVWLSNLWHPQFTNESVSHRLVVTGLCGFTWTLYTQVCFDISTRNCRQEETNVCWMFGAKISSGNDSLQQKELQLHLSGFLHSSTSLFYLPFAAAPVEHFFMIIWFTDTDNSWIVISQMFII